MMSLADRPSLVPRISTPPASDHLQQARTEEEEVKKAWPGESYHVIRGKADMTGILLASFPGLHARLLSLAVRKVGRSWAWRPGNEARFS